MAWNLHAADLLTAVYNRTRAKAEPFAEAGVQVSQAPADLARAVDAVFVIVTDDEALDDVLGGPDGVLEGLEEGGVVVNMSTVSVGATERAAAAVREVGGRFVDAPVAGTVGPAEAGTLTVLASGPDDVLVEVRPALDAMGDPVVDCGAVGDGTRTKLFVNLLLGNLLQGYAEALVFGKKQGLSFEFMQEVLADSPMHADLLDYKGAVLAERDFAKQFPVDLLRKDLDLILEAAEEQGAYLPQTAATREAVNGTSALGHGDDDMMAVIKLLEQVAGVTVGADASADGGA
jgi:3-hydroxyisobutyrate dehydrogenase/2-hydroxy-3-oxopropionate reductase